MRPPPRDQSGRCATSQIRYRRPRNAPMPSPSIIPIPDRDKALVAEKKPPILQPKASTAPTPIKSPPAEPHTTHGRAKSAVYCGANAPAPLTRSRARRDGGVGRRTHHGIARPHPRGHAARDVVPALEAVALERADRRARAETTGAEHGLQPLG